MKFDEARNLYESKEKIVTYQYVDTRIFAAKEGETIPINHLKKIAKEFASNCEKQEGGDYKVSEIADYEFQVDMEEWPEETSFGDWFDKMMKKYKVQVED